MKLSITDIETYLLEVKKAVECGKYHIERNSRRPDNNALNHKYILSEAREKEILLSLTSYDFSEVRNNDHVGYEYELLYIFGKDVELLERYGSELKTVSLYIKFNKLENGFTIVISFHEQKFPLTYYFRHT